MMAESRYEPWVANSPFGSTQVTTLEYEYESITASATATAAKR